MSTGTMRTPPEGKSRATRARILGRSVDLASTDGLEGLTIGRLAAELEMSKSGLFAHFGSKRELQLATIDAAVERFLAAVVAPAADTRPGAERLGALCEGYLDHLRSRVFPGGCFFGQAGHEFDAKPGEVRDAVRAAMGAWLDALEQQARIAGAERPAQLAFELQSLVQGANFNFQLLGDDAAFDRARSAIRDRLSRLG